MSTQDFQGQVKRIQWNNQVVSALMMLYFLISIFVFVFLVGLSIVLVTYIIFQPGPLSEAFYNSKLQFEFWKNFFKILSFALGGAFFFIYRDFNKSEQMFGAVPLRLKSGDAFYRLLENQCISRGLSVPDLFVIDAGSLRPDLVTAVVLQGLGNKSKLLLSPAILRLSAELQEAFIAQAVQRLHTKDVFFFTLLCFLGYFPFHVLREVNAFARMVFKPFLMVTDTLMAPVRKLILNLRMAKLDVGSLELTKDKSSAAALLEVLAPLEAIETYYYEAYLPLFIAKSEGPYRLRTLEKA